MKSFQGVLFEQVGNVILGPAKLNFNLGSLKEGDICVLVRNYIPPAYHDPIFFEGEEAEVFLMKYKKFIADRPDPNERVEYWECIGDDGVWSLAKEERILESRHKEGEDRPWDLNWLQQEFISIRRAIENKTEGKK